MNGNVQDELGLITEFQVAVLKALKPVILEMDPTTMHGWISNAQALRLCLQEALCPTKWANGLSGYRGIDVPAELQHLLELPLTQIFTYERCSSVLGCPQGLVSRVHNALAGEFLHREAFHKATLADLVEMSRHSPSYFWKIPGLGKTGRDLIFKVLMSLGIRLQFV